MADGSNASDRRESGEAEGDTEEKGKSRASADDNGDQDDDGKGSGDSESGDDQDSDGKDDDADDPKVRRQKRIVIIVLIVLALLAALAGLIWWLNARHWEKTDDAFIDTKITHLAPRASGAVVGLFVDDNQWVRSGQLLAQLDDSTARTQLAQAEASKAQALSQLRQAHAQIDVAATQVDQAVTDTRGPAAQADKSGRDYQRFADVRASTPAAVAAQQLDQARTTAIADAARLASARKQVRTARARLNSNQTQIGAALAQLKTAEAQIAQANVQIGYARVVAPVDGHISNRTVALGNYAQAGQELMAVVPDRLWVTANYKETQLTHIRVGQHVKVKVDAYPDVEFQGHVDSIQRGAGQSFQVLPPQNATGNFVKVVQRVPVKIVLDHVDAVRFPLGPGMSVTPSVRID